MKQKRYFIEVFFEICMYIKYAAKNYHYYCTIDVGIIQIIGDRTNKLVQC